MNTSSNGIHTQELASCCTRLNSYAKPRKVTSCRECYDTQKLCKFEECFLAHNGLYNKFHIRSKKYWNVEDITLLIMKPQSLSNKMIPIPSLATKQCVVGI